MKKAIILISFLVLICLSSTAENQEISSSSSQKISLKTQKRNPSNHDTIHRYPMDIDIAAEYDTTCNSIIIYGDYDGNVDVYLFLHESLVGYSTDLNTSFQIDSTGLYKIMISGESWYAEGYIQL